MDEHAQKELLVFGATGGTGQAIVHAALDRDYKVTVFVRDAAQAEHQFYGFRTRIAFTEGDAHNAEDVHRAIGGNLHAVVSAMGIYHRAAGGDALARATAPILDAMQTTGPKRFLCVSSIGVGDSYNQGNLTTRLIQKTTLKHVLADKEAQEALIRDSGLDWTVIRPSRLLSKGGPNNYCSWTGEQPNKKLVWSIHRAQVAELLLDCIQSDSTIGLALNITGEK